jgi:hypothetical protein
MIQLRGMVGAILGISISVAALVVTAAARPGNVNMAYLHMVIAAGVAILFAVMGVHATRTEVEAGKSRGRVAASSARSMGLIWTWGALALFATYATGILVWKEWMSFFLAFFVAAGLCLFFAATLDKDAAAGKDDPTLLKIANYLSMAQLIGMIVTMLGLLIDGKMTRFLTPRFTDWAANNIFFFGALALAAVSAYAVKLGREGKA